MTASKATAFPISLHSRAELVLTSWTTAKLVSLSTSRSQNNLPIRFFCFFRSPRSCSLKKKDLAPAFRGACLESAELRHLAGVYKPARFSTSGSFFFLHSFQTHFIHFYNHIILFFALHIIIMKFSVAALGLFAAVAAALPKSFTLVADGGYTLQTDGGEYSTVCTE